MKSLILTADGSPSMEMRNAEGVQEKMHHSQGALSESFYIYLSAVEFAIERGWPLQVLSVGLGLGYNEILSFASALAQGALKELVVISFEADNRLREAFQHWLLHREGTLYDRILAMISEDLGVDQDQLWQTMHRALKARATEQPRLELRAAFSTQMPQSQRFSVILYDAFSQKMNQDLWLEQELSEWLKSSADDSCVFVTYAAMGALKRALRSNDFSLHLKAGFAGKRNSTWAWRELDSNSLGNRR